MWKPIARCMVYFEKTVEITKKNGGKLEKQGDLWIYETGKEKNTGFDYHNIIPNLSTKINKKGLDKIYKHYPNYVDSFGDNSLTMQLETCGEFIRRLSECFHFVEDDVPTLSNNWHILLRLCILMLGMTKKKDGFYNTRKYPGFLYTVFFVILNKMGSFWIPLACDPYRIMSFNPGFYKQFGHDHPKWYKYCIAHKKAQASRESQTITNVLKEMEEKVEKGLDASKGKVKKIQQEEEEEVEGEGEGEEKEPLVDNVDIELDDSDGEETN